MLGVPTEQSGGEPSAAQNGSVIHTCTQCGAVSDGHAETCCFCDARLVPNEEEVPASALAPIPPQRNEGPVSLAAPTEGNLAVEPDWRREVARRLAVYRARRRRLRPDDAQAALPFSNNGAAEREPARVHSSSFLTPSRAIEPEPGKPTKVERVEIAVTQPHFDFTHGDDFLRGPRPRAGQASLLPVAALAERRRAGLLDAAFLLLAYAAFLAVFEAVTGHLALRKFDAAVYAATLALFYAQYFALFTVFGGVTPGMLLRRLRVVSFDGGPPTPRQLLWRSFGYLVSGGTAFLGFLWALWDEDHLTWQDRISQTYLTLAEHFAENEPVGVPGDTQGFAQK